MASSKPSIYIALASDLAIAVTKFIAAAVTRSAAMLSEGIHSVIDAVNGILLLVGIRQSKKPADANRPFGYGKELYFWSFIVSVLIFSLGGSFSFYQGILHLQHPMPLKDFFWSYLVLAVSFLFNLFSLIVAKKAFNKEQGNRPFWETVKDSKDPSIFVVLLEDAGGLLGIIIAFLGVLGGELFHSPYIDAIASLLIGLILLLISILLAIESRSLLMGEPAGKRTLKKVTQLIEKDPAIVKVTRNFSMYLAPEEIVLQLIAVFEKDLTSQEIAKAIDRIQAHIRQQYPRFKQIFIEPAVN